MQLRPRQEEFVQKCLAAIEEHGNTLGVAPTGAGKTVMGSSVIDTKLHEGLERVLVLQHRDELIKQNKRTFYDYAGRVVPCGVVNAREKDFMKPVIFASVQTLISGENLMRVPTPDLIFTDECHHAVAPSYASILDKFPDALQLGLTATPNRGDKKTLRGRYDNVADQIPIGELIRTGVLVYPRCFTIDLGVQETLHKLQPEAESGPRGDFNHDAVAGVLNQPDINRRVVREWKEKAGDRKTVVFCSNRDHMWDVAKHFDDAGVKVACIDGTYTPTQRDNTLEEFEHGDTQVLIAVAMLTEGWDCQPVSCVILLRCQSYQSTMIQMIGRGLRKLNRETFPNLPPKEDCVVLDFGISLMVHGSLEQEVDLIEEKVKFDKQCPECLGKVPSTVKVCPLCGYEFSIAQVETASKDKPVTEGPFTLREIDLFERSPFKWESFWNERCFIATAFDVWAACVLYDGKWCAIGDYGDGYVHLLSRGSRDYGLAQAADFMKANADPSLVARSLSWLHMPMTPDQKAALGEGVSPHLTKYQAACLISWGLYEEEIRHTLKFESVE